MRQNRPAVRLRLLPAVGTVGLATVLLLFPAGAGAAEDRRPAVGGPESGVEAGVGGRESVPPHAFALYAEDEQVGPASVHLSPVPDLAAVTYPDSEVSPHGAAASVWNRGLYRWCLYSGPEYAGIAGWVPPGMTAGLPHEAGSAAAAVRPVVGERC